MSPHGNVNVMFPRTLVPQLHGMVPANRKQIFESAILAGRDSRKLKKLWESPPQIPTVEELREKVAEKGVAVEISQDLLRTLEE
jgi:hypothetical protein